MGAGAVMRILRGKSIWFLLRDSAIAWDADNLATQGAALAFFSAFALAPLLILVIVFTSVLFGQEAASGHLVSQIQGLIGLEGASFVQSLITNTYTADSNILVTIFSIVTIVLAATAVFVQLRDSLNLIWRVQRKSTGTIRAFLQGRLLSFAMITGIGFLLVVSLILSALSAAMSASLSNHFAILAGMVSILDFIVSFVGITVMFTLMFKFVPAATVKWEDAWIGAAVTSFFFSIGKLVIGLYLGNGSVGSAFGEAKSFVVIMLWAYYSSQIVLYGAEFTRLYAERFGTDIIPGKNALRVVTRTVETRLAPRPTHNAHRSKKHQ